MELRHFRAGASAAGNGVLGERRGLRGAVTFAMAPAWQAAFLAEKLVGHTCTVHWPATKQQLEAAWGEPKGPHCVGATQP